MLRTKPVLATCLLVIAATLATVPAIAVGQPVHNVPGDFSTIQAAIDAAAPGDTIVVAPDTYAENLDYGGKDIRVESSGGAGVTTLDAGNGKGVEIGPSGAIVGFTITNANASFGSAIDVSGVGSLISSNVITGNGGNQPGIEGNVASPIIDSNVFTDNTCDAQFTSGVVVFVNASSPVISNNVFHDNDCRAINVLPPAGAAPLVVNNTIVGNPAGIYVGGTWDRSGYTYRNNILFGNGVGYEVVDNTPAELPAFEHNLVFNNVTDYGGIADQTGSDGNISSDPLFVDAGGHDFHLSAGSPAIDSGDSTDAPAADFEGEPRPMDGDGLNAAEFDIGADEFFRPDNGIEGMVATLAANPAGGVCVEAFTLALTSAGTAVTDVSGQYVMALDPGAYKVEFSDCGAGVYGSVWYDGKASAAAADEVAVVASAITGGIDAAIEVLITCNGKEPTIIGTGGADTIDGTSGADVIVGLAGKDTINGKGGKDTICGGAGADVINGGGGRDKLFGESGKDTIDGGGGDDVFKGGSGKDTAIFPGAKFGATVDLAKGTAKGDGDDTLRSIENVVGGPAADTLKGDSGNNDLDGADLADVIEGGGGRDTLRGRGGDDTLKGGKGKDRLLGGSGDDTLRGNSGIDTLEGGSGDDSLDGGPGDDVLKGGSGTLDLASYTSASGPVTVDLGAKTASGDGSDTLAGVEGVRGSKFADALVGSSGADLILGEGGADTIEGKGGQDILDGGGGSDLVKGGGGKDVLFGATGADTLEGGDKSDLLFGEAGNDTLRGGAGFDGAAYDFAPGPIVGSLVTDRVTGEGTDTLASIEDLYGSPFNDTLIGGGADDILFGAGGNDALTGGGGPDNLNGEDGNDTIKGEAGNDLLDGAGGTDNLDGGSGNDECLNGETVTGCEVTSAVPDTGRHPSWTNAARAALVSRIAHLRTSWL